MRIIDIPEFKDKNKLVVIDLAVAKKDELLISNVCKLMNNQGVGSMLVTKKGILEGIFTERDLLTKVVSKKKDLEKVKVTDVMTKNPKTACKNDAVADSMKRMSANRFRHLPIVDDKKKLLGIVSQGDFVAYTWAQVLERASKSTIASVTTSYQVWLILIAVFVYTISILSFL